MSAGERHGFGLRWTLFYVICNHVIHPNLDALTHTGATLCFGHAGRAAVETLVPSVRVATLLGRRAHVSRALVNVWKARRRDRRVTDWNEYGLGTVSALTNWLEATDRCSGVPTAGIRGDRRSGRSPGC